MIGSEPEWMKSPFVIWECNDIHLYYNAPHDLVENMKKFRRKHYGDERIYRRNVPENIQIPFVGTKIDITVE